MTVKYFSGLMAALMLLPVCAGAASLRAVLQKEQIDVLAQEQLVTSYKVNKKQKYPYFFPVNGPVSHASLTTETSEPFPHHRSLFFGCDRVNGGNYWQDSLRAGQIVSLELKVEKAEGEEVVFTDTCEWRQPGKAPVLRDYRQITVSAPSDSVHVIDFQIRLVPLTALHIEKTNHSLFAARMVPELSAEKGGVLMNAAGDTNEAGTFGIVSPWCDYSGSRQGNTEGLAIFQHPENPCYPAPWFTRDYGFFSPTPLYWPPSDDGIRLQEGEELLLRYRVILHAGTAEEAGIPALFEAYTAGAASCGN
ncbi:MAG TPA: PmoA family protein [Candidatus Hydrogenedentes bacterium]|jgi:hypothetical protein|nr:PmoA family protein [Candidatus Hydrogenedentota bacterium]